MTSAQGRGPTDPRELALILFLAACSPAFCGVRLIEPGEEMAPLTSFPQSILRSPDAGKTPKLDTIRVAVAGGDTSLLAGVKRQAASFDIVAPGEGPDLVWDPGQRQAMSKGEIIAYDVTKDELAAVIDRMAFAHGVARLAAARPQPIRMSGGSGPVRRKGDKIDLELDDMTNRALVLFAIAGDGLVQALYPIGSDPRVIATPTFRWTLQVREPFGTDLIVAVTADRPLDALDRGVEELSRYRSAGEMLRLIALAVPTDARIGVVALPSAP